MTSLLTTIAQGDGSGIATAVRTIVRGAAEWKTLWAAHAGPGSPVPPVDFSSRMVAAAFAGARPTPGYTTEITDARRAGPVLTLVVDERVPTGRMVSAQVIVAPFHMVALPRHDGEVRFTDQREAASGVPSPRDAATHWSSLLDAAPASSSFRGPAPRSPSVPAGARTGPHTASGPLTGVPSSTGLDPNVAAALAYLAGPFSGILILFVERSSGYVRLHAWQAVIGLGGIGLLAAAALVFSFLTLLLSPLLFTMMFMLSEVLAVLWLVVWVVCLVKAFTGREWKMPVAGRYAERLATRRPEAAASGPYQLNE